VPTLNEASNLPVLFSRIDKAMSKAKIAYEIIVIDDNSSDGTITVARNNAKRFNVRASNKKGKMGKAYSLLEGFAMAKNEVVCMIDADLQYPPEEIAIMYNIMKQLEVSIVITERNDMRKSRLRQLSTKTFNTIFAQWLFGIKYDTQSGLKLFKKEVLDSISVSPSPWSFDLEFIVRSLEAGFKMASHQIPFHERYSGEPKISVIKGTIELSIASIKLRQATSFSHMKNKYKQNMEYLASK
jgi:glycosyltransferase involved in cell wall biosynthesis